MSKNQDLILETLEKNGGWLSLREIADAITVSREQFSVDQVEFSMKGLRRNHLVLRQKSYGSTGVPVFVYKSALTP